jgi:outer membrane protein assembly factor BamB
MSAFPNLKRWLAAGITGSLFIALLLLAGLGGSSKAVVSANPQALDKSPAAGNQDHVMFGGTPSRNMVNTTAKNLPTTWSIEEGSKDVKWTADLGSKAYGGPIIAGGKIFVGTNNGKPRDKKYTEDVKGKKKPIDMGVIMTFNEADGKFLWQHAFFKLAAGRVQDWPGEGICSTPLLEGKRMYYVSNRCEVICSDTDDKELWKLDMIKELGVFPHNLSVCSPLAVGNNLFLVTSNGVDEDHINVPSPKAPSFIKVDKNTGKVLWQNNLTTVRLTEVQKEGDQEAFFKRLVNRGEIIQHGQWSNPAYGKVNGQSQVVFPGGNGKIYSFDPDTGALLWSFDCNPPDAQYELEGGSRSDFIATPVIYDNKVYIGVGQDPEHKVGVGHLWCVDMSKRGDVSPEIVTDYNSYPPKTKPNPNSALVWHFGGPAPKEYGRNYYFGRTMSTCAIHDGLCYAAELGGYVHCLDAKTGKPYWSQATGAEIWSSPFYADGKVYLGADDGTVWVFAHGKEKKILAKNDMETAVRATPVVANGMLYIITENKLFAINGKK